jgi:hypothetical protein
LDAEGGNLITVVDASLAHASRMAHRLAPGQLSDILACGAHPRRVLRSFVLRSAYRRAAFVDGELVAIWGAAGTMISSSAHVWMASAAIIKTLPVSVVKIARLEFDQMLTTRDALVSFCQLTDDRTKRRFLEFMGFEIGEYEKIGPNGEMLARAVKRRD